MSDLDNYVELQVNDEALNGFEIVDTPGLNDPVKSRSMKTKEFLSQCDVAIILSPVGQFLPAGTMRNINLRLPSEGIKHFLIIGSKIDEGIRQIPEMKNIAVLVFFIFVKATHTRSPSVDRRIGAMGGRIVITPFFKSSHTLLPPRCW